MVRFFRSAVVVSTVLLSLAVWPGRENTLANESRLEVGALQGPIRMAYYYPPDSASLESLRANIARLDIVAPHWLVVDATGRVRSEARPEAMGVLRAAHALVMPSAILAEAAAGDRILTDPAVRTAVIEGLVTAVDPWDGLALDFEGLDPAHRSELTSFIHALGRALRGAGKHYAVALPAKTMESRTGWSGAYDYARIASAADLYLVMAYGFRTSSSTAPGSTAPLPWVDAAMRYAASEIAPDRLLLGVAFYGYDWNVSRGPPARALRYVDTRQLMDHLGLTALFDAGVASATFRYEASGESHEVWFEDARSLAAKLELVSRYGLRGAGAWRLGQEDPSAWTVWDRALSRAGEEPRNVAAPERGETRPPAAVSLQVPPAVARPSTAGWLPTLWGGDGSDLALTISNPDLSETLVTLTLLHDDGSRTRMDRAIPPTGLTLELGGRTSADVAVGFQSALPISVAATTARPDGALSSIGAAQPAPRWAFPDAQSAPSIETTFVVLNPGLTRASVVFRARSEAGAILWERNVTLEPGARTRLSAPQGPRLEFFWTEIMADAPVVAARQTRFPGAAQVSTGHSGVAARWAVPNAALGDAWLSYVVVANPNTSATSVLIRWIADGREVGRQGVEIPTMGRVGIQAASTPGMPASAEVTASLPVVVERSAYQREGWAMLSEPGIPQEPGR